MGKDTVFIVPSVSSFLHHSHDAHCPNIPTLFNCLTACHQLFAYLTFNTTLFFIFDNQVM